MNADSLSEIQDRGEYAMTIVACLENTNELPVPQNMINSYRLNVKRLYPKPIMRCSPHLQALFTEERRLQMEISGLTQNRRIIDKNILQFRLRGIQELRNSLLNEAFALSGIQISFGQSISFCFDEKWNVYLLHIA